MSKSDEFKEKVDWNDALTVEQWVRGCLERGSEKEIVVLMRVLPDSAKEKYRAIWKEFKQKKGQG